MLSVSQLREKLGGGADLEPFLSDLRNAVVALWEQHTGRLWESREDYVEVIEPDTDRSRLIQLALWPVSELTKVEGRADGETTWTENSLDDYLLLNARLLRNVVGYHEPLVRVTYTGGYTPDGETACPRDVRMALLTQAEFMVARTSGNLLLLRSQNFQGGAGVYEEAHLHPTFKLLAQAYHRKT